MTITIETAPLTGLDLDALPPCEARINGVMCEAPAAVRVRAQCPNGRHGSVTVFLCGRCYGSLTHKLAGCGQCGTEGNNTPITDWRRT